MSTSRKQLTKDVEEALNKLKIGGQKLTETEIPPYVFKEAHLLVRSVNYDERYHATMFDLLLERGKGVQLSMACDKIKQWKSGLKELLRYPMDLYLAPNRPELKIIKVSQ